MSEAPTFLEKLKAAIAHDGGLSSELGHFLVCNAERIAALIEAVTAYGDGWAVVRMEDGENSLVQLDAKPMIAARKALDEGIR